MQERWNKVFRERTKEFLYEPYLDEDIDYLKPGALLDVGAGDGRNTFYFAEKGFKITCLDYSQEGIKKIHEKSQRKGLPVETILFDVFYDDFSSLDKYDSIVLIHFFPDLSILEKLYIHLKEEGTLYCLTFINDVYEEGSVRHSVGISHSEIEEIKSNYNVIEERNRTDERGDFYSFIIRRD